jgi:hypothetical protein
MDNNEVLIYFLYWKEALKSVVSRFIKNGDLIFRIDYVHVKCGQRLGTLVDNISIAHLLHIIDN